MTTERPQNTRLQVDLRALFVITLCIAIGLAIAAAPPSESDENSLLNGIDPVQLNWHFAFLAAASVAVAIGLVQEARVIRRHQTVASPQSVLRVEIALRLSLAFVLFSTLTLQLLIARGFVTLPENENYIFFFGDVMTTHVWWLALGIAITERIGRSPSASRRPFGRVITIATSLAGMALALYLVWDLSTITYLVHAACHGVDASHPAADHRYPLRSLGDEVRLASLAFAAVLAVALAAIFLGNALRRPQKSRRISGWLVPASCALLTAAGAFCVWYYAFEFPRISPDLAGVGVSSNWFLRLGGGALATMVVMYAAYRLAKAAGCGETTAVIPFERSTVDSLFTTLLLLAAAGVYCFETVRYFAQPIAGGWESLTYLLIYPDTYFMVGLTLLSIQLARTSWRRGVDSIDVTPIDGRRFTTCVAALALLAGIAIPTFAAFGVAFWLGPWYRW